MPEITINFVIEGQDGTVDNFTVDGDLTVNGQSTQVDDIIVTDVDVQNGGGTTQFKLDGDAGTPSFDLNGNLIDNANQIRSQGGGSDTVVFEDAANSNNSILNLNEGGNVEVPNGELTLSADVLPSININPGTGGGAAAIDITHGNGDTTRLQRNTSGVIIRDQQNSFAVLDAADGGTVSIPNGSLNVDSAAIQARSDGGQNAITARSSDARLTTDGSGGGQWSVFDQNGTQDIARFKEGGTVEIPNGDIDLLSNGDIANVQVIRGADGLDMDAPNNMLIDIDAADSSTVRAFKISHDDRAEDLFEVQESGDVTVHQGPLNVSGGTGAGNGILFPGQGGGTQPAIFIDANGEVIARDDDGNTTQLT